MQKMSLWSHKSVSYPTSCFAISVLLQILSKEDDSMSVSVFQLHVFNMHILIFHFPIPLLLLSVHLPCNELNFTV